MTDLSLVPEAPVQRKPTGWRCQWVRVFSYAEPAKPPTRSLDFDTREAAEAHKARLRSEDVVATVTPIWPKPRALTKKARRQALEATGWPIQMAPPR